MQRSQGLKSKSSTKSSEINKISVIVSAQMSILIVAWPQNVRYFLLIGSRGLGSCHYLLISVRVTLCDTQGPASCHCVKMSAQIAATDHHLSLSHYHLCLAPHMSY